MNKFLPAAALALMVGLAAGATSPQESQPQQLQVFQDQDTRLNSVYATDQQGNFYGFIFRDDGVYFFGTVDSFDALEGDNIEICQHYLVRQDRLLREDRTLSEVSCSSLQESQIGTGPMPPPANQTNQTTG